MELHHGVRRPARVPNFRLGLLMTGLIIAAVALLSMQQIEWYLLKRSLYVQYQNVGWIHADEVQAWMNDAHRIRPIVLDVRSPEEWNVGHLPGALAADANATPETLGLAHDAPIVTCDAVGFRAAKLSRRLRDGGFTKIYTLDGGVFSWANEKRPLENGRGEPTTRVHPFNAIWGKLLHDNARAATR